MHESVMPALIVPGEPIVPQEIAAKWDKAIRQNREIIEKKYPLADIDAVELEKRRSIELQIDKYFSSKLDSYGIPLEKRRSLPDARYVNFSSQQLDTGLEDKRTHVCGICHNRPHMISMPDNAPGDMFDMMYCLAHEKSHASTLKTAYLFFNQDRRFVKNVEIGGMEILGNHQEKASLLEECFAQIDATIIADTVLQNTLQAEYEMRQEILKDTDFWNLLQKEYPSFTENYSMETIIPHIEIEKSDSIDPKKIRISKSFAEYLLGIKICEKVGKTLTSEGTSTTESPITRGFKFLDKTRYTRSNEAHRKITEVFGGKKARYLFSLPAHLENTEVVIEELFSEAR